MKKLTLALVFLAGCGTTPPAMMSADLRSPEDFFGHPMGADRTLARWPKIVEYFRHLDSADTVEVHEIGKTTLGKPFLMVLISTPENLKNKDRYRDIAKKLFSGEPTEEEARELAKQGKTICYISCNLHSTEIGSSQTAPELAYRAASGEVDMENVIFILMPSINPDGQVMVSEWYDKYKDTKWEGGPLPVLYHHFAGHDNNRDFYFNNLTETRMVSDIYYKKWFPHVITDHHQMGSTAARMFVPPYDDPVAERLHPMVTRWNNVFGTQIACDMESRGLPGVTHQKIFSSYWMGGSQRTPFWQNRIGLLTETASCRIATPIDIDRTELRNIKPEIANPSPWQGGTWRLRDIVDYQMECSFSVIRSSGRHKESILFDSWQMARDSIEFGRSRGAEMHVSGADSAALKECSRVLAQLGIGHERDENGIHVPLDRPWSRMVMELFGKQTYPEGDQPYDVVAWTLSWMLGLDHEVRDVACIHAGPPTRETGMSRVPQVNDWLKKGEDVFRKSDGTFTQSDTGVTWKLFPVRLGLFKPNFSSMDEGWTRLVLEKFQFDYKRLLTKRIKEGKLNDEFDCIILPDISAKRIKDGRDDKVKTLPEELQGGIGKEGVKALKEFVENGGTLITFDESSLLAMDEFGLPVRNAVKEDKKFSCPGSILNVTVDNKSFLGLGMPEKARIFFARSPVLQTSLPPRVDIGRKVIVRFDEVKKPLQSGFLQHPEALRGRAAMVEVTLGKGRVVLFGFRPQHRGQTWGTFPLIFNAIYASTATSVK